MATVTATPRRLYARASVGVHAQKTPPTSRSTTTSGTLYLAGDEGDDTFPASTCSSCLQPQPLDKPDAITNLTTLFGGTGSNRYEYLQNAPVQINGGTGFDTIIIDGTPLDDTFVITSTYVAGAGRIVNFTNIESVEVDGGGGNDSFWVLNTNPDLTVTVNGGSGDDTIHIGGTPPPLVYAPPPFTYTPPAYTVTTPPDRARRRSRTTTRRTRSTRISSPGPLSAGGATPNACRDAPARPGVRRSRRAGRGDGDVLRALGELRLEHLSTSSTSWHPVDRDAQRRAGQLPGADGSEYLERQIQGPPVTITPAPSGADGAAEPQRLGSSRASVDHRRRQRLRDERRHGRLQEAEPAQPTSARSCSARPRPVEVGEKADGTPIFAAGHAGRRRADRYVPEPRERGPGRTAPAGTMSVEKTPYFGCQMLGIEHLQLRLSNAGATFLVADNGDSTGPRHPPRPACPTPGRCRRRR